MSHLADHTFRLIFNQGVAPQVVLKRDAAFTVLAANTVYLHMTGQTEEDILGRSFREMSDRDPVLMPMATYLKRAFHKAILLKEAVRVPVVPRRTTVKSRLKLHHRDVEIIPVTNAADEVEYLICSVQGAMVGAAIEQYDHLTGKYAGELERSKQDPWTILSQEIGARNQQLLSMNRDLEQMRRVLQGLFKKAEF